MAEDKQAFLSRWSRRKLGADKPTARAPQAPEPEASKPPAAPAAKAGEQGARESPAQLPPLDKVGIDTDFRAFMGKEVEEGVRRAALKKLFADPRFNVMDGLDTYIDDYTKGGAISEDMLAKLDHAKHTLFGPRPEEKEAAQDSTDAQAAAPQALEADAAEGDKKPEGKDGAAG